MGFFQNKNTIIFHDVPNIFRLQLLKPPYDA